MKLVKVVLENYGPFAGTHEFMLADRGLVLVRGDNRDEPRMNSNGSGKSSLVESIDWCLFGVVPRGDAVDSIMCADSVTVTVTLIDDDGVTVEVTRGRVGGKARLALRYDGDDATSLDPKETQTHIEWHLGVDRQVFHATVLFAQTDMFAFADATDAERIAILTKILRLEEIDAWADSAKCLRDDCERRYQRGVQEAAQLAGEVNALEAVDHASQTETYEVERRRGMEDLHRRWVDLYARADALAAETAGAEDLRRRIVEPEPQLSVAHAREAAEVEEINVSRRKALEVVGEHLAQVRHAARLVELGDVCVACEQLIPPQRRDDAHKNLRAAQAGLETARTVQARLDELHAAKSASERRLTDAHRREVAAWQQRIAEARAEITQAERRVQEAIEYRRQAEQAHEQYKSLQARPNPFHDAKVKHEARLADVRARLKATQTAVAAAQADAERATFWVTACGPKGLKSYILDARLQEMTDAANNWVRMLTGGTIWVRLETVTPTRKGESRNRFNVRVFRQEADGTVTDRNYKSWSGGEKQRVSLGIDFGLSRLIAQRARKPYDTLILDEVFRHLDASGREAVMEMLQSLRREKTTILVVDHDAEFQALFERTVTVRKEAGRSRIVEEATDGPADTAEAGPVRDRTDDPAEGAGGPVAKKTRSKARPRRRSGGQAGRQRA